MRCSLTVRALTLIFFTVLSSHSFANAQSDSISFPVESPSAISPFPASPSPTDTPTGSVTPAPSSSDPAAGPTSSDVPVSSSSSDSSSPSSSFGASSSTPAPSSDSSAPSSTSFTPSDTQSSSSAVPSSSSSVVTSSPPPPTSSVPTSSSLASSSPVVESSSTGPPSTLVLPATAVTVASTTPRSTSVPHAVPISTAAASSTAVAGGVTSGSSKGFFANSGAVAGTFTVVALLGVGAIVSAFMYYRRRQRRLRDDEEAIWFEKGNTSSGPSYGATDRASSFISGENGENGESHDDIAPMTAAGADAYPDRSTHYGDMGVNMGEYGNPATYGMEYPPGTAYATAAAQQGQYTYGGHVGGYPNNYQLPPITSSSPTHPFADPTNATRSGGAPPVIVTGPEPSHESEYYADAYITAQ